MKQSFEDILKRGFLIFCGALFALPTYILWKEVVVGHQWPDDFNGWLGLIMFPTFSIVAFLYAIFYRRAKEADERLQEDMDTYTRRGKTIFVIGFSLMFLLLAIQLLESHIFKSEPFETWEYFALPLFTVVWVVALIVTLKVDDEKLHNFLIKMGWHWLDRQIFKDAFDDEENNEIDNKNEDIF